MRAATLIILAITSCSLPFMTAYPAAAKKPPCSSAEMAIADERGGKICLKKSEWAKAKKTCPKNPMDCICQDGDSVGACGN